jgi:hypothetical protein
MAQIDIRFDNHNDSPITLPLDCYIRVSSYGSDSDGLPMLTNECVTADDLEAEVGRVKSQIGSDCCDREITLCTQLKGESLTDDTIVGIS